MKKLFLPCAAVLAAVFILGSCQMEKRHYRPGYHVDWNNHQKTTAAQKDQANVTIPETTTATQAFQAPVATEESATTAQQPTVAPAPAVAAKSASTFNAVRANDAVEKSSTGTTVSSETKTIVKKATSGLTTKKPAKKGPSKGLLIVLAILIPWLAVGLATDWDVKPVVICILLGFLFCLPGIIYAIIVVNREA